MYLTEEALAILSHAGMSELCSQLAHDFDEPTKDVEQLRAAILFGIGMGFRLVDLGYTLEPVVNYEGIVEV